MQHSRRSTFLFVMLVLLSLPLVYGGRVGLFSTNWSYQALSATIPPHALNAVGHTVYYGSAVTTSPSNYLYARDIPSGNLVWQYNVSLPVNYVSNFSYDGDSYIIAGTGGSTAAGLVGKSHVIARTSDNATFWKSPNLVSSVSSLGSARNATGNGEDVLAGLQNGTLVRLTGKNGSILRRSTCTGDVFAVSELINGSVVVGTRELITRLGHIYAFRDNGSLKWEMTPPLQPPITLIKTFADINHDGTPEVIAVFYDSEIHVLNGADGNELSPQWPFSLGSDNVKDLLCKQDYTGDGFPDILVGTEDGNLTIVNGFDATLFRGPARISTFTVSYVQYMYFYQDGIPYSNRALATSIQDASYNQYIYGVNTTDLTVMRQFQVPIDKQALNLFNVGNYTNGYTGDLIFTSQNTVYDISGTEIIYPEFPSQVILISLIMALWFLVVILRRQPARE